VRFAAVLCVLAAAAPAAAQDRPTVTLLTENDSFVSIAGDRHYTNGIYGSWTSAGHAPGGAAALARLLMLPGARDADWRTGYFFGQAIFTPDNLSDFTPPVRDRPYAGWLFGGARLYRDSGDTLDKIEATIGMVGPAALGSDVQKFWHAAFVPSAAKPLGWHAQLRDEPGLVLSQQRIWRVRLAPGLELLPEANASAGNIYDYAGAGAMLRFGQGLSADWGPPRIAPAQQGSDFQSVDRFAWYVFAGGEGRAVARNIFLDGNSFQASPNVARQTLVGDISAGAAMLFPGFRLLASYTWRSKEFRGQYNADQLASLSVSFVP
jgi:hypothetical protein